MFRSMNSTQKQLVDQLKKEGTIKSQLVYDTLLAIDRKFYVPSSPYYNDSPSSIGYGATISAPHMHSMTLEKLLPALKEGGRALDIGAGSGYVSACFADILGPKGTVVMIDHI